MYLEAVGGPKYLQDRQPRLLWVVGRPPEPDAREAEGAPSGKWGPVGRGSSTGEACATYKGFLQEAALLLPLSWASSSVGFHLSSCGFSSISHPLGVTSCFWPMSPSAMFSSLLHHASLAGSVRDPWIVPDPVHQIAWREGRRSKQQGSSGGMSHSTSWLFPHLVSGWAPPPGPLPPKWESGWRPGPAGACVLRQAEPSRHLSPAVQELFLLPAVWKARTGSSFQAASSPVQAPWCLEAK